MPSKSKEVLVDEAPVKARSKKVSVSVADAAAVPAAGKRSAPRKRQAAVKSPSIAAESVKLDKPAKPKKPKMVRDSLTMPKQEYAVIDTLKTRALKLERSVKKTELIRAGIKALEAMSDAKFLSALSAVPSLKTGRPTK